ncbi:N-acyl amino acid synthase FeeM domain-containing protein [Vibrio ziniensis]|uniref:N-acyl amino acid synthase FeeM catalytic core domain-containing protein n=1 Tax=Vibrio ziniensis TaxID=2711221 RepID=A0A6G7CML6_9VIBR|nr:hypothetical protein [Vibrio ziniensis]QIH43310.1 hypothetical protein G5S32_14990 [Vibrio ziniensis]
MEQEKSSSQKLNGKTVPVERRKEVRLSKDENKGAPEICAVTYKIADGKEALEQAFSLVWKNYVETGLQRDDHEGIRFTKYHMLPDTRVFVACYHKALSDQTPEKFDGKGQIVGTVTLVLDSPMGLPMEEFCASEVAKLRAEGRRMAEVIAFSVNPKYTKYKVFLHMFKLLFQFAAMKEVTDLCCSVTERHIKFYRKVCLFEPMGELLPYSAAYKLKVQGHRLNIEEAQKKAENFYSGKEFDADLHRFFFTEGFNRNKGEGEPLSEELLHYFLKERSDFLVNVPEDDLCTLRAEYDRVGKCFPF